MKKSILILGSEGQIGGHLQDYLKVKKKYNVIKFDLILGKKFDLRNFNNYLLEKQIKKLEDEHGVMPGKQIPNIPPEQATITDVSDPEEDKDKLN